MKFIQVSDLHLGAKFSKLTTSKAKELREEETLLTKRLFDYAKQIECEGILIPGDLFDGRTFSPRLAKCFFDAVKLSEVKTFYLRGNHDEEFSITSLPENFYVVEQDDFLEFDNYTITGQKLGNVKLKDDKFHFHLMHGDIFNSNSHDGIDIKNLKNKGLNYLALGHLHSFQSGNLDERAEFVYSGSLFSHGFDETGDKGFVEIEIEDDFTVKHRFVRFARRAFDIVKVDISGFEKYEEIKEQIKKQTDNLSSSNLVRVILSGYCDEQCEKFLSQLNLFFENRFYYFELIDNSKIKIDIEKLKEEKLSFKSEFLKLIEEDLSLSQDDKNLICQLGIEALRGDDLSI